MSKAREMLAVQFARDHGFDGVIPYGWGCFWDGAEPDGVPDDCDWYEAGVHCLDLAKPLHPIYDSTLHIIIVDDDGARWRSESDARTLLREPIIPNI